MHETNRMSYSAMLLMPDDFDVDLYDSICASITKRGQYHHRADSHFAYAWKAIAYRFRAMAECDEDFTDSFPKRLSLPIEERFAERYRQEKAVFGFFANGISSIECFFYAAYCFACIVNPNGFPLTDSQDLKFTPLSAYKKFATHLRGDGLTSEMECCLRDPKYREAREMRDVLMHRGALPRTVRLESGQPDLVAIPENPKDLSDDWRYKIELRADFTMTRRQWLSDTLAHLLARTSEYCRRNFDTYA